MRTRSMRATRSNPALRKQQILTAAIALATRIGHMALTRDAVAARAHISSSLVAHYFKTVDGLRRAVFREAVRSNNLPILSRCLFAPGCRLTPELHASVLEYLAVRHSS